MPGAHERTTSTPAFAIADLSQPHGQRILKPALWAPDGVAAIPTAALDPPRRVASPMVLVWFQVVASPVPTFTSIGRALAAAIMGILFVVQTYTGIRFSWATPDTIATIIGLLTPVLVWGIPNKRCLKN